MRQWDGTADEEVVKRVLAGETALYEILMRRYNQRLYRVARSILRNDVDAEDVMQEAYVRAYEHLNQFAGETKFSTWLTKIAVYEALGPFGTPAGRALSARRVILTCRTAREHGSAACSHRKEASWLWR